ncbi:Tol-Pal system protein TolB [Helicobacter ailurogastricus]|uniref:Tol-Pal system beta propeller repeat protein TolB n=1 Tax=Helicobacter ailurogastricus TaxID=1578720 RepID=A0A0K2XCQ7_9HELI|nr:Tol-Pal system protein TolB [Helicobacter ailurogastricus]CRF41278.1 Tol-Pal system beta propeller repeat protein TolB [Helicobacter ailurogastricus]CRF43333.1 Tol-Pal system beta propeller repeat protein TolB [Helicobacter ailurogastricus]CRF44570.1 Tol-Pal system beta propeller repeat protein TolB [Helicobacter ailurogastricus]CRF51905.1 tolB protein precursor, periplasmic protein involved in the tonb-independent uptake of group A colicins [Helicobacter ailurogastricus]BDQ29009.1 protein 
MRIVWLFLALSLGLLRAADATLDIVKTIEKLPKVLVTYTGTDPYLKKIADLLVADLKVSGHFDALGANVPNAQGAQLVVQLQKSQPSIINAQLYNANTKEVQSNKDYQFNTKELYPFIAHKIAIDANRLTKAAPIDWMARMVVFSKFLSPGVTSIVVADYTLTYQQEIIKNNLLNVFPKWADAQQSAIYYTQYLRQPTIIKYNVRTGESAVITQSQGMAAVSSVSADGRKLLLSLAPKGQTDIYLYNTQEKELKQLTSYSGIDVLGNFVEDEKAMVFVSDRSGYPNIYLKKLKLDAPVEQVVFYSRNNDSVASFGDYLVYVSREERDANGQSPFNLYLINLKGDYVRRLTASGVNQMPRFSKDGKAVMFLKRAAAQNALGVILLENNQSYLFPLENINIQSFDW